jgi:hypothetical protein
MQTYYGLLKERTKWQRTAGNLWPSPGKQMKLSDLQLQGKEFWQQLLKFGSRFSPQLSL